MNAATSTLLVPALRLFQDRHPAATVEVLDARQNEIHQGLVEGSLDLGLVNVLAGDDAPPTWRAPPSSTGAPSSSCPQTTR